MEPFYGNEATVDMLRTYALDDRFPHGILLLGETGLGKKTLALRLAAMAMCPEDEDTSLSCQVCSRVLRQIHPDVRMLRADNKSGTLSVKQLREDVLDDCMIRPNEGRRKIYILADTLTPAGQNTLLKSLEEPPEYAMFILMATREDDMLPTILSRTVSLRLKPLDAVTFATALGDVTCDPMGMFALTGGNLGQARLLLETGQADTLLGLCGGLFTALQKGEEYTFLTLLEQTAGQKDHAAFVLRGLATLLRSAMALALGECTADMVSSVVASFAGRLRIKRLTTQLSTLLQMTGQNLVGRNETMFRTALCTALFEPER